MERGNLVAALASGSSGDAPSPRPLDWPESPGSRLEIAIPDEVDQRGVESEAKAVRVTARTFETKRARHGWDHPPIPPLQQVHARSDTVGVPPARFMGVGVHVPALLSVKTQRLPLLAERPARGNSQLPDETDGQRGIRRLGTMTVPWLNLRAWVPCESGQVSEGDGPDPNDHGQRDRPVLRGARHPHADRRVHRT